MYNIIAAASISASHRSRLRSDLQPDRKVGQVHNLDIFEAIGPVADEAAAGNRSRKSGPDRAPGRGSPSTRSSAMQLRKFGVGQIEGAAQAAAARTSGQFQQFQSGPGPEQSPGRFAQSRFEPEMTGVVIKYPQLSARPVSGHRHCSCFGSRPGMKKSPGAGRQRSGPGD